MSDDFEVKIAGAAEVDVFLCAEPHEVPWELVESLDRAGVRVVGTPPGTAVQAESASQLIPSCSGVILTEASARSAAGFHVPIIRAEDADGAGLEGFIRAVIAGRSRVPAYAFLVGRLERDFAHARSAIDAAVHSSAGMPCVWADDRRLHTNCASVSMRTQRLIEHAQFVVADLTLGVESPHRENPSRAHEVGMAIAYRRPLMLCSREPRRSPYFSIQDLQMSFWSNEAELAEATADWIDAHREIVSRYVFNHRLAAPRIAASEFTFVPELGYSGPYGRSSLGAGRRRLAWRQ